MQVRFAMPSGSEVDLSITFAMSQGKLHSEFRAMRLSTPKSKSWFPTHDALTPHAFNTGGICFPFVTWLIRLGLYASPENSTSTGSSEDVPSSAFVCACMLLSAPTKRAAPATGSRAASSTL